MSRGDQSLLAEIERDAIDDRVSLVATLRKCATLGTQTSNDKLRDWANRELDGYTDDNELPEYRIIYAPLKIDVIAFPHEIRGQQISALDLPDFARDLISEKLELAGGVSKLQGYIRNARETSIKMSPHGTPELLKLWNHQICDTGRTIMALYWDVNVGSIEGLLDQIRTALVRLVSEMRANMPDDGSAPSPEQAEHAVSVVLQGGKRNQVTVTAPKAVSGSTVNIAPNGEHSESGWAKTIAIGTVILVVVGIISVYLAYLLLHQQRSSVSASTSIPQSSGLATRSPTPSNKPSFNAFDPTIKCDTKSIDRRGFALRVGCDSQEQPPGSIILQYQANKIVANVGVGQFFAMYPTGGDGPASYYNACVNQPAQSIPQFDTEHAPPWRSYFCYVAPGIVVACRFNHLINSSSVELMIYEWFSLWAFRMETLAPC